MEMAVFLSLSLVVVPEGLIIQGDGCLAPNCCLLSTLVFLITVFCVAFL
jgi:hypothetical protein